MHFEPPSITEFSDPGPAFSGALRAACGVTDTESTRYALGCVRLDPQGGRIEATDSHCLLIARGFRFAFDAPVLLTAPHALSVAPLRNEEVRLGFAPGGKASGVVVLSCGDWTVWAPEARDARFPDLDRVVPAGEPKATATLSAADAAFLADRLGRLPGAGDERKPVTLEIKDGLFLIRAADEGGAPVELATDRLRRSAAKRLACADRRFLDPRPRRWAARELSAVRAGGTGAMCDTPEPSDGRERRPTVVFATLAGDPVSRRRTPCGSTADANEPQPRGALRRHVESPRRATARRRIASITDPEKLMTPGCRRIRISEHASGVPVERQRRTRSNVSAVRVRGAERRPRSRRPVGTGRHAGGAPCPKRAGEARSTGDRPPQAQEDATGPSPAPSPV